jgi:hypothetical protein
MDTIYPKKYWWLVLVVIPVLVAILHSPIIDWIFYSNNEISAERPNNSNTNIKVSAKGVGYPKEIDNPGQRRELAKRAAVTVALRNLAEKVKATIKSSTITKEHVISEDEIQLKTEAIIRSYKIINSIDLPNGSVEVTVEALVSLDER